jgi:hypothetical protein
VRGRRTLGVGELAVALIGLAVLAFGVGAGIELAGLGWPLALVAVLVLVLGFLLLLVRVHSPLPPSPRPMSPQPMSPQPMSPQPMSPHPPSPSADAPAQARPNGSVPRSAGASADPRPNGSVPPPGDAAAPPGPPADPPPVGLPAVVPHSGGSGRPSAASPAVMPHVISSAGVPVTAMDLIALGEGTQVRIDRALLEQSPLIPARSSFGDDGPRGSYFLGVAGGAALALSLGGLLFLALPSDVTALVVLLAGVVAWATVMVLALRMQLRR